MSAEKRELVFGKSWYWLGALVAVAAGLYALREVLTPIFLAITIAYILDPVVDRLEKWRIPRGLAIAIVLLGFTAGVAAFLLLVIPEIARDIASVAKELPGHAQRALTKLEPMLKEQGIALPHTTDEWIAELKRKADSISASQLAPVGNALKAVIGGTVSAIGAVFGALIVPILAVYLLADFDRMVAGIQALIPHRYRTNVSEVAGEIDRTLSQFMRGQLTVMLILALLYGGAYWLLGVRLAIPIGIAAGILNFVPYVGGAFALVAGILMSLIGGGGLGQLVGVVVAYAVVQTLEGFVITPRIVGESVGLREIWVLLALFVGGEVFGFLGVLLAVPAAAVLKIFVTRAIARYEKSELFLAPASGAGIPPLAVAPEPEPSPVPEPPALPSEPEALDSDDPSAPAAAQGEPEPAPTRDEPSSPRPAPTERSSEPGSPAAGDESPEPER